MKGSKNKGGIKQYFNKTSFQVYIEHPHVYEDGSDIVTAQI